MRFNGLVKLFLFATISIFFFACNGKNNSADNVNNNGDVAIKARQGHSGIGAKYGCRDPYQCDNYKEPTTGFPSRDQVIQYYYCQNEDVFGDYLNLKSDVQIEMGMPRQYDPGNDATDVSDIDATLPVIPIRGSFKNYHVSSLSQIYPNDGKNCDVDLFENASGLVYKDSHGDWQVRMGSANSKSIAKSVAPPQ